MAGKRAKISMKEVGPETNESRSYITPSRSPELFSDNVSLEAKIADLEKQSNRVLSSKSSQVPYIQDQSPHTFSAYPEIAEFRREESHSALKQAVQESLAARDYLQEKIKVFHEALTQETKRNHRITRENEKLAQANAKLKAELTYSQAELVDLQAKIANLESRNIELVRLRPRSEGILALESEKDHSSETFELISHVSTKLQSDENAEIQRYLSFVVTTLEAAPDLRILFRGRVQSTAELNLSVSRGNLSFVLTRMLQVLSDFLVFYNHRNRLESPEVEEEENPEALYKVQTHGTQTTVDRSLETEDNHLHSPSISIAVLDSVSKSMFSPPKMSTRETMKDSPQFTKGEKSDEYVRMYEEHRNLLSSLNVQSDRLSRLNQQLSSTMNSSRRLLSSQLAKPALSFLSSSKTGNNRSDRTEVRMADIPEPDVSELQTDNQIEETIAPDSHTVPEPVPSEVEPAVISPGNVSSRPMRSRFPVYRAKNVTAGRRPVPPRRGTERDMPVLMTKKEDGWNSVSEFFNAGTDFDRKKAESSGEEENA